MARRPGERVMVIVLSVVALLAIFLFIAARPGAKPDQLSQSNPAVNEPPLLPQRSAPSGVVSNSSEVNESALLAPALDQPIVGNAVQFDVSKPLRDIPLPPIVMATTIREMTEPADTGAEGTVSPKPFPPAADPVVQRSFGTTLRSPAAPAMPSPLNSFEGVNNIDGVYPPDMNGDVGPKHYVQIVNLHFQIFDKAGMSVYGPAPNNIL